MMQMKKMIRLSSLLLRKRFPPRSLGQQSTTASTPFSVLIEVGMGLTTKIRCTDPGIDQFSVGSHSTGKNVMQTAAGSMMMQPKVVHHSLVHRADPNEDVKDAKEDNEEREKNLSRNYLKSDHWNDDEEEEEELQIDHFKGDLRETDFGNDSKWISEILDCNENIGNIGRDISTNTAANDSACKSVENSQIAAESETSTSINVHRILFASNKMMNDGIFGARHYRSLRIYFPLPLIASKPDSHSAEPKTVLFIYSSHSPTTYINMETCKKLGIEDIVATRDAAKSASHRARLLTKKVDVTIAGFKLKVCVSDDRFQQANILGRDFLNRAAAEIAYDKVRDRYVLLFT